MIIWYKNWLNNKEIGKIVKKDSSNLGIGKDSFHKFAAFLDEKEYAENVLKDPKELKQYYDE